MLDVEDGLVEQVGDVRVVQGVDDPRPSLADHEPEMAQHPQLVRDRRPLHPDRGGSSLTEHGDSRSRPRIRTRLGVASACIVCATSRAVAASSSPLWGLSLNAVRHRPQRSVNSVHVFWGIRDGIWVRLRCPEGLLLMFSVTEWVKMSQVWRGLMVRVRQSASQKCLQNVQLRLPG